MTASARKGDLWMHKQSVQKHQLRHYRMATGESACGETGTTCAETRNVNCGKCVMKMLRDGILKVDTPLPIEDVIKAVEEEGGR